jgi:hypothetical protein
MQEILLKMQNHQLDDSNDEDDNEETKESSSIVDKDRLA